MLIYPLFHKMDPKEYFYQLLLFYTQCLLDTESFCNKFHVAFRDKEKWLFSSQEEQILANIFDVVTIYSPYEEDKKLWKYSWDQDVKNIVTKALQELFNSTDLS